MGNKVIAISGLPGAGSTTIGKSLAERLRLSYFSSGELFKDVARGTLETQHYYTRFKELCDSKNITIPKLSAVNDSEAAAEVWKSEFGRSKEFHEAIDELQIKLANEGNIVIDGKLSLYMVKNADLKVWLKASLDKRAERLSQRDSMPLEEARTAIEARENQHQREWSRIYGLDYFQQEKEADTVIDTSDLISEQVTDKIIQTLNQ